MTSNPIEKENETNNYLVPDNDLLNANQKILENGRVQVSFVGWAMRFTIIGIVLSLVSYRIMEGWKINDSFMVYSTLMPLIMISVYVGSWLLYKNPAKGKFSNDLVSVVIPIYNQKAMIESVIHAIYRSTYKNIEVIAVNDGSNDGTENILDDLKKLYPDLKVLRQRRGGKRKASAAGFYASSGKFIVHIDSDSVIDENAIAEIMKTFYSNPEIGAVVGEMRAWNARKNLLTKIQDAWFITSCNINKSFESSFGSVTCCSGPLSGFRRDILTHFMPYWKNVDTQSGGGIDRELTAYIIAPPISKQNLLQALWPKSSLKQKLLKSTALYDDSDDRLLTAQSLIKWKTAYIASAIVYVEAQETLKRFIRQQIRWKKGFLRTNFYLSTYFWKKRNPIASIMYYLDFMIGLTQPLIVFTILLYEPLILNQYLPPVAFTLGIIASAFAQGLDMKFRYPKSNTWKYIVLLNLLGTFVLSWLIFNALWNFKKNSWMTR